MRMTKEEISQAIQASRVVSDEKHYELCLKPFAPEDFKFDLQLFGKGGGKKGKIFFSILGLFVGLGVGFFALGLTGGSLISAALIGASIGSTIWTATHKSNTSMGNDGPSIQRFDKAQETMSSTGAIPVVYGTRKIAGNQTFHETSADQNTLHKHVVLCEGEIDGIESVCANGLLIPTNGQTQGTVFTIRNTRYSDAKVWKDKKDLHLFCNGHDRVIYLCNKDDAEKADTFYEWQTSIAALVSYINRLNEGWQAFPTATTTKYPGDLRVANGGITSQGIITCTQQDIDNYCKDHPKTKSSINKILWNRRILTIRGHLQAGDKIETEVDGSYFIVRKVNYPVPAPVTVEKWGRTYTYTPKLTEGTRPSSYDIETFGMSTANCYNEPTSVVADTVTGGTSYTFHDCEPPSNYNEVGGYPRMAWLDMVFNASQELSGGNPSVECIVRGKKVYDPRTGRTEYSENPALIVGDFLCNKRYGLGRFIDASDLDIDSFVSAANYCDEVITVYDADNNPIKSKRYTLNMVIDQRQDAIKWLQEMLANFAGWLVISKNKLKLLVERPTPVCYKFDDDNIKDLKVVPLKANDTPNQYQISLCSPEVNWKVISCIVNDFADQKARGKVIQKQVELSGVTSQWQALRLARYYSDYNLSCPLTVSFTTGVQALALECGDVVTVTYRDAFTAMPIRIATIKETAENEFEISGRQYNESIYTDDLGGGIQTPNYSNHHGIDEGSDYFFIANVEQLKAETQVRKNLDGKTVYDISVTYQLPANYFIDTARVYYKTNATGSDSNQTVFEEGVAADELGYKSDWKFAGEGVAQVTIPNVHVGDVYKIRVVSKTRKGKLGDIDSSPEVLCKVNPKSTVPAKPYNLRYDFRKEFRFMWEDVADSDVVYYEVRTDNRGGQTEGMLGRTTAPTIAVKLTQRFGTIYVYAVNAQKKVSEPASCEYAYPKPNAPIGIELYPTPRGMRIVAPPLPDSCTGMVLYIKGGETSEKLTSNNAVYTFTGKPDIYTLRVAYVDLIGEGYLSQEYTFTVEPTFDEEWIKDGTLSIEKMDKVVASALKRAQTVDADVTKLEESDGKIIATVSKVKTDTEKQLKDAEGKIDDAKASADEAKASADEAKKQITGVVSQVTQTADQITHVIAELGKDPKDCEYSAITQLLDGINLRVKKTDINGKELINQINMTAKGTTIDGKYLHVTGTTKFDDNVITNGMIKAGAITADKMASQMITLNPNSGVQGFNGGNVKLDHTGMTVNKTDGSSVIIDGRGMTFKGRNGGEFASLGAFMVGVAHDGQYVKFNQRWDRVPSVFVSPVRLQTSVAGFTNANIYQQVGATEVSQDGFRINCRTVLGAGSGGSVPVNARFFSGNTHSNISKSIMGRRKIAICGEETLVTACSDPYGNGDRFEGEMFYWMLRKHYQYFIPDSPYFCVRSYTITPPAQATKAYITMSGYLGGAGGAGLYSIRLNIRNNIGQYFLKEADVLKHPEASYNGRHQPANEHDMPYSWEYMSGGGAVNASGTFEVTFPQNGSITIDAGLHCYHWIASASIDFWVSVDNVSYNTGGDTVVAQGDAQFMVLDQSNKLYTVH